MTDTFDAIGRRLSDSQKATSDDTISFSIIKYNENTTNEPQHPFMNEQDDCSKVRNELKNVRNRLEEQERINETLMRKVEALEQKESEVTGTESSTVRPLAVATIIIKYPCCIIIAVLLLTIIAFAIDATVFEFHDGGGLEYFITSAENTGKMFAYWVAVASAQEDMGSAPVKTLEQSHFQITTLFKTRDGSDILQPQYLPFIQEINDKIVHSDYDEYYRLCLSDSASFPNCSSTAITDPLIQGLSSSKSISDISQQDIDNLKFGLPYPDINVTTSSYRNKDDQWKKQWLHYEDWILPIWRDIQLESNNLNIEVVLAGPRVRDLAMLELTMKANLWSAASIMFVYVILTWHLQSLFLSTAAIGQILLGFPISYFIFKMVFGIGYFGTLHTLIIFVILGIAADDCFVFNDAWIQSELMVEDPEDLVQRMSYTFRRATTAMAITSATTFIAFLATYFSPMMPISSFGLWAGTVVLINYLLVITYFPAIVSFHQQYVKRHERCPAFCGTLKLWICGLCRGKEEKRKAETRRESLAIPDKLDDQADQQSDFRTESSTGKLRGDGNIRDMSAVQLVPPRESRKTELFLRDKWSKWMIDGRFFILGVFAVLVGFSIWQTTKMEGQSEQEKFFADDHFMEKAQSWPNEFYGGSVGYLVQLALTWGVEPRADRSGLSRWEIEDRGRTVWDDTFDLSPMAAQQHVFDICETLLASDKLYNPSQELNCFLFDLIDYAHESRNLSFPFDFSTDPVKQQRDFNALVGEWVSTDPKGIFHLNTGNVGMKRNQLVLIAIGCQLNLHTMTSIHVRESEFDFWEKQIGEWNQAAPESVSGAFQSSVAWAWMDSEKAFATSAVQGVAMALPAAFVVLVLSTGNWIISALATLSVICILATEVMLMVLQGWKLGVSESVGVVIMVGFSIDYVVHFAASYVECDKDDRNGRIRHALHTMGISIISGAITTFGSGAFLIFPEFKFFAKFGILIMSVVAFSLLYSMTFFIAILAVLGPEGTRGELNIKRIVKKLKSYRMNPK